MYVHNTLHMHTYVIKFAYKKKTKKAKYSATHPQHHPNNRSSIMQRTIYDARKKRFGKNKNFIPANGQFCTCID